MKKQLIIAAISCLLLISCSKNNNTSSDPPATVKEYFRGKLNGIFFNDTTLAKALPAPNNGLQITGYHPSGSITLWLKPYTATTGERIVSQDHQIFVGNNGGQFYAGFINSHVQGSGKITILEITGSFIRGTFEGIVPADSNYAVLPTQIVSEGEFKLKKQ